jgi:hypothetical protein
MSKIFNNEDLIHKFDEVNAVGSIHVWGPNGTFWANIPHDTMPCLIAAINAGKFKYITLFGNELCRGYAAIQWFSFKKDISDWE